MLLLVSFAGGPADDEERVEIDGARDFDDIANVMMCASALSRSQ